MNDVGLSLGNIATVVPAGMVVFFASYSYMASSISAWKASGTYERISKRKAIFEEPATGGNETVLRNYQLAIKNSNGKMVTSILKLEWCHIVCSRRR